MHDSWLSRIVKPLGLRIDPFFAGLFLFFSPTPQIIEVLFHELLAFDLFLLVSLSLRTSLFKISQESHLDLYIRGKCN